MMTTTAVTAALAVPAVAVAVAVAVALSHLNRHQQDPRRRRRPRQGHRQGRRRHWCRCLLLHTRTINTTSTSHTQSFTHTHTHTKNTHTHAHTHTRTHTQTQTPHSCTMDKLTQKARKDAPLVATRALWRGSPRCLRRCRFFRKPRISGGFGYRSLPSTTAWKQSMHTRHVGCNQNARQLQAQRNFTRTNTHQQSSVPFPTCLEGRPRKR